MRSMTGFGKSEFPAPDGSVFAVELSSVNRKQLELRINLPNECAALEPLARRELGAAISRGAVSVRVTRSAADNTANTLAVNDRLLESFAAKCVELRRKFNLTPDFDAAALLALPGVLSSSGFDAEEPEIAAAFARALADAIAAFGAMREAEGEALKLDLAARLEALRRTVDLIRPAAASITASIRQRLLDRLAAENLGADPSDERFQRELLFYADRSDVSEELTRLDSHFAQFTGFLGKDGEPVGRSLDFLVQEMFREITTLGNKAGSSAISPHIIFFKAELEKIREQIQNVE
ncbi:MAG: YicC/YloC family endoribonuclease [Victivallaceae bacterium]